MGYVGLVGPGLRLLRRAGGFLGRGIDLVAGKADANPKAFDVSALVASGSAWLGLDPATRSQIGKALVWLGQILQ